MTQNKCQYLAAYFDGELPIEQRGSFEDHLRQCASCRNELEMLQQATKLMSQHSFEDISELELARLHDSINGDDDQTILRISGVLALIAASVLIICTAWVGDLPSRPIQTTSMAQPQAWEQMAMTLRPGPLQLNNDLDDVRLADAHVTDWMLQNLSPQEGSQP